MTHRFTIPADLAHYIAKAALAAAESDPNTPHPVLRTARVRVAGGRVEVVTSNRYRVHRITVPVAAVTGDAEFLLPVDALEWLNVASRTYQTVAPVVTIRTTGDRSPQYSSRRYEIIVSAHDDLGETVTRVGSLYSGTFPPVERLFEITRQADVDAVERAYALKELEQLQHLAADGSTARVRVHCAVAPKGKNRGATLFTVDRQKYDAIAEALIQPVEDIR